MDTLRTNRAFHGWGHKFLYSSEMVSHIFERLGYVGISFCDYGQSRHPALSNIEKHGKFSIAAGFPSVIIVEGMRGDQSIAVPESLISFLHEHFLRQVAAGH